MPAKRYRSGPVAIVSLGILLLAVGVALVSDGRPADAILSRSADSPQDLVRRFLEVLAEGDRNEIRGFELTRQEFEQHVYPRLPASRPSANMSVDFLWKQTQLRSLGGLSKTMSHAGRKYDLNAVSFADGRKSYGTFQIHRDARLLITDEEGRQRELNLFGSIMEMNGEFKIYSFAQ